MIRSLLNKPMVGRLCWILSFLQSFLLKTGFPQSVPTVRWCWSLPTRLQLNLLSQVTMVTLPPQHSYLLWVQVGILGLLTGRNHWCLPGASGHLISEGKGSVWMTISQLRKHFHNITSLSSSQLPCEVVDTADNNYTGPHASRIHNVPCSVLSVFIGDLIWTHQNPMKWVQSVFPFYRREKNGAQSG